jgi:hypothetical protein
MNTQKQKQYVLHNDLSQTRTTIFTDLHGWYQENQTMFIKKCKLGEGRRKPLFTYNSTSLACQLIFKRTLYA